jgi:hypothetical protein
VLTIEIDGRDFLHHAADLDDIITRVRSSIHTNLPQKS